MKYYPLNIPHVNPKLQYFRISGSRPTSQSQTSIESSSYLTMNVTKTPVVISEFSLPNICDGLSSITIKNNNGSVLTTFQSNQLQKSTNCVYKLNTPFSITNIGDYNIFISVDKSFTQNGVGYGNPVLPQVTISGTNIKINQLLMQVFYDNGQISDNNIAQFLSSPITSNEIFPDKLPNVNSSNVSPNPGGNTLYYLTLNITSAPYKIKQLYIPNVTSFSGIEIVNTSNNDKITLLPTNFTYKDSLFTSNNIEKTTINYSGTYKLYVGSPNVLLNPSSTGDLPELLMQIGYDTSSRILTYIILFSVLLILTILIFIIIKLR